MGQSVRHKKAVELAIQAAIHLQLHTDSVCTACQYLHRFYKYIDKLNEESGEPSSETTEGPRNCDTGLVVATCLYIACKSNESHIRLSELISSVQYHLQRQNSATSTRAPFNYDDYQLLVKHQSYWKLRDSVVEFEFYLLRVLEFDLTIDLPHKYLIFYLKSLSDWINKESLVEELFLLSWSLMNDYYCNHPESTRWEANQSALACIELAIMIISPKIKALIENKQTNEHWYTNFDKKLKQGAVDVIIEQIFEIYNRTQNV